MANDLKPQPPDNERVKAIAMNVEWATQVLALAVRAEHHPAQQKPD